MTLSTAGIRLVGDKISQDEWECSVIQNAFAKETHKERLAMMAMKGGNTLWFAYPDHRRFSS